MKDVSFCSHFQLTSWKFEFKLQCMIIANHIVIDIGFYKILLDLDWLNFCFLNLRSQC